MIGSMSSKTAIRNQANRIVHLSSIAHHKIFKQIVIVGTAKVVAKIVQDV